MRDITAAVEAGNEKADIALEALCYGVKKYIGSYAAAMGGLDAVVFTAGIGEHVTVVRERVLKGLGFMGIDFCPERNRTVDEGLICTDDSKVKALVVATDEEMAIARDTLALV